MRDAREWAEEINARYEYTDSITLSVLIQRIQSEAARSERERAARVCDDEANADDIVMANLAKHIASRIRHLPDDNALGAEGDEKPT